MTEPAAGEIVQHASDTHVVDVETTAAQCLEEIHNPFAVTHGPQ